jgi:hypothetical protein
MVLVLNMDLKKILEDKMNVNNEDMIHKNDLNLFEMLINLIFVQ